MFDWINTLSTEALIALVVVSAIPAMLVARFVVFMIFPKSWLRKWFSG